MTKTKTAPNFNTPVAHPVRVKDKPRKTRKVRSPVSREAVKQNATRRSIEDMHEARLLRQAYDL